MLLCFRKANMSRNWSKVYIGRCDPNAAAGNHNNQVNIDTGLPRTAAADKASKLTGSGMVVICCRARSLCLVGAPSAGQVWALQLHVSVICATGALTPARRKATLRAAISHIAGLHTCADKPPCLNTSHEATPMAVYSALHTGPNTALGGVQDGFFSFVYLQCRISFLV